MTPANQPEGSISALERSVLAHGAGRSSDRECALVVAGAGGLSLGASAILEQPGAADHRFLWVIGSLVSLHREDRRSMLRWLPAFPPPGWSPRWHLALCSRSRSRDLDCSTGRRAHMLAFLIPSGRRAKPSPTGAITVISLLSMVIGGAVILIQRPPPPGTHPLGGDLSDLDEPAGTASLSTPGAIDLGSDTMVYTSEGSLNLRLQPMTLAVSPLLRFISRSADGCWTVLARPADRAGPEPRLRGAERIDDHAWNLTYDFPGQGPARLRVDHDPERRSLVIDAATRLDRPVFSHLNSYCDIEVRGHHRLKLEFSPCPGARIEVLRLRLSVRPSRAVCLC